MNEENITISIATKEHILFCDGIDAEWGFQTSAVVYKNSVKEKHVLIASIDNQIVGYLRYGWLWERKLPYIQVLRVSKKYQRQGIGKALITKLEEMLRELNVSYLLSSTEEANDNSLKFHESLGFVRCGDLDINEDGQAEIFLMKKLL